MVKIIEEKQNISKENLKLVAENLDLKNELLILKLQINENENENDSISGNEKYLMDIESNIVKDLEKKLEDMKKEYEESLEELKRKEIEFKDSKKDDNNINNENEDSIIINEINELKKDIEDKKSKIEQLENEIKTTKNTDVTKILNKYVLENYKKNNNQVLEENNDIEEQFKMMNLNKNPNSIKDDKNTILIENLQEEINDKDKQIEKLIEENNNLKKKNSNHQNEDETINNNNNDKKDNQILRTCSSKEANEIDKIKLYKNQIKDLKDINESDKIQIKALKEEIKELKENLKKMETFSGQVKNFGEFIGLFQNAFLNYKPKKKEQKDALNKLINILNNHHL